jgi:hypothetical protein
MNSTRRMLTGAVLVLALVFAATPAYSRDWSARRALDATADVLLFRPWQLVASSVGFGFFMLTSPVHYGRDMILHDGKLDETGASWEGMVGTPFYHTFFRPLGAWEAPPWERE